jgi:hypothetical protein
MIYNGDQGCNRSPPSLLTTAACGETSEMILAGMIDRGERKQIADDVSKTDQVMSKPRVGPILWDHLGDTCHAMMSATVWASDEAERDAHLNGKVASALMETVKAKAGDLFATTPEIHKVGILADKLPK